MMWYKGGLSQRAQRACLTHGFLKNMTPCLHLLCCDFLWLGVKVTQHSCCFMMTESAGQEQGGTEASDSQKKTNTSQPPLQFHNNNHLYVIATTVNKGTALLPLTTVRLILSCWILMQTIHWLYTLWYSVSHLCESPCSGNCSKAAQEVQLHLKCCKVYSQMYTVLFVK